MSADLIKFLSFGIDPEYVKITQPLEIGKKCLSYCIDNHLRREFAKIWSKQKFTRSQKRVLIHQIYQKPHKNNKQQRHKDKV